MEYSSVQLDDLPDEMLLSIFKQMSNVEVLYSLSDVNQRLNTIVRDQVFTSHLNFSNHNLNNFLSPLFASMLDRYLFQIFPKIHNKVKRLDLVETFVEHIHLFPPFPNLHTLGLFDLEINYTKRLFTDETSVVHKFKNQISSLLIHITKYKIDCSTRDVIKLVFIHILTKFTKLQCLNICSDLFDSQRSTIGMWPSTLMSSTLLELHICLEDFADCLCLLDGRFNQLKIFKVKLHLISTALETNNKEKLVNLRCFSLRCDYYTGQYYTLVVPLVHRMVNLEELNLHILLQNSLKIFDGNDLKESIVNHLTLLKKFTFYFRSNVGRYNGSCLPSKEYLRSTMSNLKNNMVVAYFDRFVCGPLGQCHLFTWPYQSDNYDEISHCFPDRLVFKYVRNVSLFDSSPFEHEFFVRLGKCFPLMTTLRISTDEPQKKKFFTQSNQHFPIVKYSNLIELDLDDAHSDYLEQFLLDTKTCLVNDVELSTDYRSLKKVTHNFTRNATRINCSKMRYPYERYLTQFPKNFKNYFNLQQEIPSFKN